MGLEINDEHWSATEPCRQCKRRIINAGIRLVVARQGPRPGQFRKFLVKTWIKNNLYELQRVRGRLVPREPPETLSEPVDKERALQLKRHFGLHAALVVQVGGYEDAKHAVARVAARYFLTHVRTRSSVALSCGDTILSMLDSLPRRPELQLTISQLSIEGDPKMIHQAPATLVGLLRSKCSSRSQTFGLQLPPLNLFPMSGDIRKKLIEHSVLAKMRREARHSDYVFVGLGSAGPDSTSFWAMVQTATGGRFALWRRKLGIVGEMNNQVFDGAGANCSDRIPGFSEQVINVLTLDEIREMAKGPSKHKVVMVATGRSKIKGMRVALESGLANVLITSREDADRLLKGSS